MRNSAIGGPSYHNKKAVCGPGDPKRKCKSGKRKRVKGGKKKTKFRGPKGPGW